MNYPIVLDNDCYITIQSSGSATPSNDYPKAKIRISNFPNLFELYLISEANAGADLVIAKWNDVDIANYGYTASTLEAYILNLLNTGCAGGGGGGGIESIVAGTNITVDNTDPLNPIVSATGGGGADNWFTGFINVTESRSFLVTDKNKILILSDNDIVVSLGGTEFLDNGDKVGILASGTNCSFNINSVSDPIFPFSGDSLIQPELVVLTALNMGGETTFGVISTSIINDNGVSKTALKYLNDKPYKEVAYGDAAILIADSKLNAGTLYKITDRGDRGLFFHAISTNELSNTGIRKMLCPAKYGLGTDGFGNNWIGVWHLGLTGVTIDDLTIRGGLVWKNLTGNTGTALDDFLLDDVNWVLVPKESFTNGEYTELQFDVVYDFASDWIRWQTDEFSNGVGFIADLIGFQPVNCTDWNSIYTGGLAIYANHGAVEGIYNNVGVSPLEIANNSSKVIKGNDLRGASVGIFANKTNVINYNSNNGNIGYNDAPIITNLPSTVTDIELVSVSRGSIDGSTLPHSGWNGQIKADLIKLGTIDYTMINAGTATSTIVVSPTLNTIPSADMYVDKFILIRRNVFVSTSGQDFDIVFNTAPNLNITGIVKATVPAEYLISSPQNGIANHNLDITLSFNILPNAQDYTAGDFDVYAVVKKMEL